jgi:hypothetical protein
MDESKKKTRKKALKLTTIESVLAMDEINEFLEELECKKSSIRGIFVVWMDDKDDLHLNITNLAHTEVLGGLAWANYTILKDKDEDTEDEE